MGKISESSYPGQNAYRDERWMQNQNPNSGLHYEAANNILYAIWSYGVHKIRAMRPDGTNIVEWDLVGDSQEGVALWDGDSAGKGKIFIAEDAGEIWRYEFNSQLEITIIGNGSVEINPDPPGYYGTFDTLTAIPDPGYQFLECDNPETLLMDYDKKVTATFIPAGLSSQEAGDVAPSGIYFARREGPPQKFILIR